MVICYRTLYEGKFEVNSVDLFILNQLDTTSNQLISMTLEIII